MLTLYAIPASLYCAKVRIVLRHKRLQWKESTPPGGYGSDEYKRIVASGNLPALVDRDSADDRNGDLLLADSEAIAEYLNEKYPAPPMLPQDIAMRARVRERGRFHDTRLEPSLRALFSHIAPSTRDKQFVVEQTQQLNSRLMQLGELLTLPLASQFEQLSLGDCGFAVTFAWIDALTPVLNLQIDWPHAVIDERTRLLNFDAVASELSSYRPEIEKYTSATAKNP